MKKIIITLCIYIAAFVNPIPRVYAQQLELLIQKHHSKYISKLTLSPSGKYLVTAGGDDVYIWNTKSLLQIAHPKELPGGFRNYYFKQNDELVYTTDKKYLRVLNLEHMTIDSTIFGNKRTSFYEYIFVENYEKSDDVMFHPESFEEVGRSERYPWVAKPTYAKTKTLFYVRDMPAGKDELNVYDYSTDERIINQKNPFDPRDEVNGISFINNDTQVLGYIRNKDKYNIVVWDLNTREYKIIIPEKKNPRVGKYNEKRGLLPLELNDEILAVMEVKRKKLVYKTDKVHEKDKLYMFSPSGKYLVAVIDNTLKLIDFDTKKSVFELKYKTTYDWQRYYRFSPKENYFLYGFQNDLFVFDLKPLKTIGTINSRNYVFNPEETQIITAKGLKTLKIYSTKNMDQPINETYELKEKIRRFTYLPDYKSLRVRGDRFINLSKFEVKQNKLAEGIYLGNNWFLNIKSNGIYKRNEKTQEELLISEKKYEKIFDYNAEKNFAVAMRKAPDKTDSILEVDIEFRIKELAKYGGLSETERQKLYKDLRKSFTENPFQEYVKLDIESGVEFPFGIHTGWYGIQKILPDIDKNHFVIQKKNKVYIFDLQSPENKHIITLSDLHTDSCERCETNPAYLYNNKLYYFTTERRFKDKLDFLTDEYLYTYDFKSKVNTKIRQVIYDIKDGEWTYNVKDKYAVRKSSGIAQIRLSVFDFPDLKPRKRLPYRLTNYDGGVEIDPFSTKAFLGVSGGRIVCYDMSQMEELYTITTDGEDEMLINTPEGYYTSTKNAMKHVAVKKGNQVYNFEQFDLLLNRPDKVFERMGLAKKELIDAYYHAYLKRLRRMGFKPEDLSVDADIPEIEISNEIPFESATQNIMLEIKAWDTKNYIDRINIYVNNVPVFGKRGKSIYSETTKSKKLNATYELTLSKGLNKIQVSAHNVKGLESILETQLVFFQGNIEKPDLYVIAIGVSDFDDNSYDLTYAAKDAMDIGSAFSAQTNRYGKIHKHVFTDQQVSVDKIKDLKKVLNQSKVDDQVILFVASHGLLDNDFNYYIGTPDVNFEDPSQNGLPYEVLEDLLDGIPARKKLMLIDACHSGEVDKEESILVDAGTSDENVNFRGFKKIERKNTVGLEGSFELMQQLFTDLRRGTGAVVIASAGGGEFAFESPQWNNGVFTYSALQGLKTKKADRNRDGVVKVSELRDHVFNEVNKLTNGRQNPTSRRDNLELDFVVW